MTRNGSLRLHKPAFILSFSALLCVLAFSPRTWAQDSFATLPRTWAKDRFVTLQGDRISAILDLSHESHKMVRLDKEGAPYKFVNDDLEELEVNEGPCIFVGLQPPPGPGPIYEVFMECFDLVAEKGSKSFLYATDSTGHIVRYSTPATARVAVYGRGDPQFDIAGWKWVMEHVSPQLEQKVVAERTQSTEPLKLYKINPKGEHNEPRVTAPILTHSVDAKFSTYAIRNHISVLSVVGVVIDTRGMPVHVHTIHPAGFGLDEEAAKSVQQYRFQPARLDGQPVPVEITIGVNFRP